MSQRNIVDLRWIPRFRRSMLWRKQPLDIWRLELAAFRSIHESSVMQEIYATKQEFNRFRSPSCEMFEAGPQAWRKSITSGHV